MQKYRQLDHIHHPQSKLGSSSNWYSKFIGRFKATEFWSQGEKDERKLQTLSNMRNFNESNNTQQMCTSIINYNAVRLFNYFQSDLNNTSIGMMPSSISKRKAKISESLITKNPFKL